MANTYSNGEDLTWAGWGTVNVAPIANTIIAPDGTLTADTMIDDAVGGTGNIRLQQNPTVTQGVPHHTALFAKPKRHDKIRIQLAGFGALLVFIDFDVTNGTFNSVGADVDDYGVEYQDDNGWFRPWLSFTPGADTAGVCRIYLLDDDYGLSPPLDGTSDIYLWGVYGDDGAEPEPYVSESGIRVPPLKGGPGIGLSFGKMGRMGA